jgi:hypothetical protein
MGNPLPESILSPIVRDLGFGLWKRVDSALLSTNLEKNYLLFEGRKNQFLSKEIGLISREICKPVLKLDFTVHCKMGVPLRFWTKEPDPRESKLDPQNVRKNPGFVCDPVDGDFSLSLEYTDVWEWQCCSSDKKAICFVTKHIANF